MPISRMRWPSSTSVIETIKAGPLVDMGSVTEPLPDDVRKLFQQMADGFRDRFVRRVSAGRPAMTEADRRLIADGRVVAAPQALALHMIDAHGYLDDAIADAERLAGVAGAEVVLFQRSGYPTRSDLLDRPQRPAPGRPHSLQLPRPRSQQASRLPLPLAARSDPDEARRSLIRLARLRTT